MRSLILILILGCSLATAGCATKAGTGTAVGAGAGGLIGGALGGTTGALVGVIAGGALGYGVGQHMDNEDRRRAAYALEQNQQAQWRNEQTGAQYTFVPEGTVYSQGRQCRRYRIVADVEGRPDNVEGTACRNPDGTWESIST
jgi:surface antigen